MAPKRKVDYSVMEDAWREGLITPEQMATAYTESTGIKVSRVAIINHFKRLGIMRDMTARVKARAEAIVTKAMVTGIVTDEKTRNNEITDFEIERQGGKKLADVLIKERDDIFRARVLVNRLFKEIEQQQDCPQELADLGEMMHNPDVRMDKLNEAYHKVISFSGRVENVKKLADALRILVLLERDVYGLTDAPPEREKVEKIIIGFKD